MNLPVDIWVHIALKLDHPDILSLILTNKYIYRITEKYLFWKGLWLKYEDMAPDQWPDLNRLRYEFKIGFHRIYMFKFKREMTIDTDKLNPTKRRDEVLGVIRHRSCYYAVSRNKGPFISIPKYKRIFTLRENIDNYICSFYGGETDTIELFNNLAEAPGIQKVRFMELNIFNLYNQVIKRLKQQHCFRFITFMSRGNQVTVTLLNEKGNFIITYVLMLPRDPLTRDPRGGLVLAGGGTRIPLEWNGNPTLY